MSYNLLCEKTGHDYHRIETDGAVGLYCRRCGDVPHLRPCKDCNDARRAAETAEDRRKRQVSAQQRHIERLQMEVRQLNTALIRPWRD